MTQDIWYTNRESENQEFKSVRLNLWGGVVQYAKRKWRWAPLPAPMDRRREVVHTYSYAQTKPVHTIQVHAIVPCELKQTTLDCKYLYDIQISHNDARCISYTLSLSVSITRAYRNSTLSQCQNSTMWQSFRVVISFYKTLDKHGSSKTFDQQDLITINSDHGVTFIDSSNDSHSVNSNTSILSSNHHGQHWIISKLFTGYYHDTKSLPSLTSHISIYSSSRRNYSSENFIKINIYNDTRFHIVIHNSLSITNKSTG